MVRTLLEEINELPHKTNKERVWQLVGLYSSEVDNLEEYFDRRYIDYILIQQKTVTGKGIDIPKKIFVNGAPYPFPKSIDALITICELEGVCSKFDWLVELKIEYGLL